MPTEPVPDAVPAPHLRTGAIGEAAAVAHLVGRGHEVVARNWRVADHDLRGELDLVTLDHATAAVVVVEVKTRRTTAHGGPLAAVSVDKQRRIRRLAASFLAGARLPYRQVRFDVVGVVLDRRGVPRRLEHVRAAF